MGDRQLMGLDFGLNSYTQKGQGTSTAFTSPQTCKRKFRWLTIIENISASGINSLPPSKGARPSISLKEMEARHLSENYYYPVVKPEWKPLALTLYDLSRTPHPVFAWLKKMYNPETGEMYPSVYALGRGQTLIIPQIQIEMYDGCGKMIEQWILEDVWPTNIDFQELDMNAVEICMCDLQLRYARAYIKN